MPDAGGCRVLKVVGQGVCPRHPISTKIPSSPANVFGAGSVVTAHALWVVWSVFVRASVHCCVVGIAWRAHLHALGNLEVSADFSQRAQGSALARHPGEMLF